MWGGGCARGLGQNVPLLGQVHPVGRQAGLCVLQSAHPSAVARLEPLCAGHPGRAAVPDPFEVAEPGTEVSHLPEGGLGAEAEPASSERQAELPALVPSKGVESAKVLKRLLRGGVKALGELLRECWGQGPKEARRLPLPAEPQTLKESRPRTIKDGHNHSHTPINHS